MISLITHKYIVTLNGLRDRTPINFLSYTEKSPILILVTYIRTFPAVLRTRPALGGKSDHCLFRLCYSVRRYIPGVAPEVLRCVPLPPDTPRLCPGHRRHSPSVTTASHGSSTAKSRCYAVAYEYHWNIRGTYDRYVICKVQNSSYKPRRKRAAIRVVEKIGNGVINETSPSYTRLSLIQKLLRIIQTTWLKI